MTSNTNDDESPPTSSSKGGIWWNDDEKEAYWCILTKARTSMKFFCVRLIPKKQFYTRILYGSYFFPQKGAVNSMKWQLHSRYTHIHSHTWYSSRSEWTTVFSSTNIGRKEKTEGRSSQCSHCCYLSYRFSTPSPSLPHRVTREKREIVFLGTR